MSAGSRKLVIVGGDSFLMTAMRIALRYVSAIDVLGVLDRGGSIAVAVSEAHPDIAVIEASGDPDQDCERLRELRVHCQDALIVIVATEFDMDVFEEAARRGALACLAGPGLAKGLQALLAEPAERDRAPARVALAATNGRMCVAAVTRPEPVASECPLTARELEVLRSVAEGRSNAQIGRELWLSEQTVKFHLSKIYRKRGVTNRTEASRYAHLNGHVKGNRRLNGNGRLRTPADDVRILDAAGL